MNGKWRRKRRKCILTVMNKVGRPWCAKDTCVCAWRGTAASRTLLDSLTADRVLPPRPRLPRRLWCGEVRQRCASASRSIIRSTIMAISWLNEG